MNYGQRSDRNGPRGNRGRGGGRGNRGNRGQPRDETPPEFSEKVVFINRCSKVVKGGRRFSFSSLIVTGDQKGRVGVGYGKANQVPEAIRKGSEQARKNMVPIRLKGDTIPHEVIGQADGGRVLLRPATTGTGVIAGGGVRAVLEAAGVKNVLSKSLGSNNHIAVVQATLDGLRQLKLKEDYEKLRGLDLK